MRLLQKTAAHRQAMVSGLILITSSLLVGSVFAADSVMRDTLYFHTPPSVDEIGDHLFPARTRSLVIHDKVAASKPAEKSIGLPVLFHFGKTTLVNSSKPYLDKIGELMQQPAYANETLIIEGHTDAVGTDRDNFKLSELRALTVKDYLVTKYSINPLRLFPEGKGERQLFDAADPLAGVNRRVEFLRYR